MYMYTFIYIYIYIYTCMYAYIYIYKERERGRCVLICLFIAIVRKTAEASRAAWPRSPGRGSLRREALDIEYV